MKGGKSALGDTLKRQILTLELEPDHDLDEVQLSEAYGISRTPVRDVLRRLAGEGYVEIRENRGARVIPMTHATLRDFFLVAPLIYEAVGRLAVQNFRSGQMDQLKACQQRFRAAATADDGEAMVVENNAFHAIIGAMAHSGNRLAFVAHCDTAPYNNIDARNALKWGIDRQKIVDTVYKGFATVGCDTTIAPSNKYFAQTNPPHTYDPDKAKFLWKKAASPSFELEVSEGAFPGATDSGVIFQELLKAAGIDLNVKRVSGDGYWSNVWLKSPFCAVLWFSRASVDQQLSQTFLSQANWNDTNWRRPDFDKIVEAARVELDDSKRKELYAQAQHMIAEDGGMVCYAVGDYLDGYSKKIQGAAPHPRFEMCDQKVAEQCWFA